MSDDSSKVSAPFNIRIPGYQIKRMLGKGGMATVYLAVQESFGRDVAIKVLSADMAQDQEFSQRFLREAQIVSRLQHPNIVTVYDVGIHEGYHYLSMEYIPGHELREAKYDLSKADVIRIVKEVARALEYAHKQGYIHRDVKPENIMLHENGERVVLMDFGIARMTLVDNSVTKTGKVIGTPHYMSPEQTKGLTVDHRSDIYSLGVVLYQLLAGRVPYDADTPVAVGIMHISEPVPSMPPGLEVFQPVINGCMSKNPEHRYQSARELINALDSLDSNAIAAIDARAKARQQQQRVVSSPGDATMAGTAIMDGPTSVQQGQAANKTAYNIPPLVHPDRKKYQSQQQDMPKRRSRLPLLLLLLLLGGSAWGYFNQAKVLTFWNTKLRPQAMALAIKYQLIPAPVEETATSQPEAVTGQPVAPTEEVKSQPVDVVETASQQQAIEAQQKQQEIEQLKANLAQQPENALALAQYYKEELENTPGDLSARNGLSELREWYRFELRSAIEDHDLVRARKLANQLKESFPKLSQRPRFLQMLSNLAKLESTRQHMDKAEAYLKQDALAEPAGANALEEYRQALSIDPSLLEAKQGIEKIADVAFKKASYHKGRGELKQALKYINAGLNANPLHKDLVKMRDELGDKVERLTRHETLNRQAEILFRSGNLVVPEGNSAFDKYSQVLKENPNNIEARSGIRKIENYLVEYANIYLEESDLEKARGVIDTAVKKFGLTPKIEEVKIKIDAAVKATEPKVGEIRFSSLRADSLQAMSGNKLRIIQTLFVGFSYTNFKGSSTILQANLLDGRGRVLITSKKITVTGSSGEQVFDMEMPTSRLADGSYRLELILGADKLIVGTFINDNNL